MTIANLKEFIAKFSESRQNDNDGGAGNDEIEEKLEELGGKPALNPDIDIEDVYGPCIPDDEFDEPTPCVYGPPSWYDDYGNLDPNNPDAKRFIDEIDAIEERNRLRAELRKQRQMKIQDSQVNEPHPKVYGPNTDNLW